MMSLLPRKLAMLALPLLVVHAAAARAAVEGMKPGDDDDSEQRAPEFAPAPEAARAADTGDSVGAAAYYPPAVDGPALRLPEPQTRLYLDGSYAIADDLTALPYIAGKARNVRAALGGGWRWGRFAFEGQLPVNLTTIDVSSVLNMPPLPEDQHQTAVSLGDLTLGAIWTDRLADEALIGGLGLRGRLATHTTRFVFHLADGSIADFVVPYYFHIEPTVILGGAIGRFTYVVNQGAIALVGPDGNFEDAHITVPSIFLYEAHYAIGWAPWTFLGASAELATVIQLNHIPDTLDGQDLSKFNGIRAVWLAPALQVHAGDSYRIDAIARFGLSRGQELYGVLEYVGTHSFTLRVTRAFN